MRRSSLSRKTWATGGVLVVLAGIMFVGCHSSTRSEDTQAQVALSEQKTFDLKEIEAEQAIGFLSQLALGTISIVPDRNAVVVVGSASDLYRASIVLDLVDTRVRYVVETLASVLKAGSVPSNNQIAEAFGGIRIATFANPPGRRDRVRALIDVHGESIVAIIPAHIQRELLVFIESGPSRLRPVNGNAEPNVVETPMTVADGDGATRESSSRVFSGLLTATDASQDSDAVTPSGVVASAETTAREPFATEANLPSMEVCEDRRHAAGRIVPKAVAGPVAVEKSYTPTLPANAEDVLQLNLPDRLELIQLLDLVAEYLSIDYLYEPEKIRGQSVSLRLHGKLQGEIRVKDLHPLLESVLKFKGLAMTCHKGNLVTIVPAAEALQVDPTLLDANDITLSAGDMVVTRAFNLQYVDTASAMNLLDNMKLGVAASPVEGTGTLIVTCYAHRMDRIKRLLEMVDRPGKPREFRFRQLKYAMAHILANKAELLVSQLETIPVQIAPLDRRGRTSAQMVNAPSPPSLPTPQGAMKAASNNAAEWYTVYLDADERTNRLLMIGPAEQLAIVEELIDVLDVAQHDPRTMKVYPVTNLQAADAKKKLEELEIVRVVLSEPRKAPPLSVDRVRASPNRQSQVSEGDPIEIEQIKVTVLEATNSLLVNAVQEQHARVAAVLSHMDVVQPDSRSLKVYEIEHVDAEEVKKQLSQFDLVGKEGNASEMSTPERVASPDARLAALRTTTSEAPQVSVLESTNSLLINATGSQHARMASVIEYVDTAARQEAIPYEIYSLENQDPEHLAEVLQSILQETIQDKDAKVEKVVRKLDEEIVIVPDKNTFSLIVYASKKSQDWISKMIRTLDKRRPQVLIDATLVEIRKSDEFNYDLDLVASIPDLTTTSGQTQLFMADETTTVIDRLQQSDRSQFLDFQVSSGKGIGFYGDRHIQTLLTAVQTKNYGRILAKPKVLVNDNEKGSIKTADTTYVETRSSVPVTGGTAGTQNNLIETAISYEPYEAGITLEITPHISEGDLLRLEIQLSRSDFTSPSNEKPPNQTSSNVGTVVTVPDGSTIILGGMLKLNQNKGGSKVPILGDIPLIGGIFRGIDTSDIQSMLYIFVRAEIIRPAEILSGGYEDLKRISDNNRDAFERHEQEFQDYQTWPGIKPKPVDPLRVLEAQ